MKKFILILAALGLTIGCALCLAACSGGKEYSITCENPEEGRVIVADNTVKAGENVILAAKPKNGYQLVNFLLDGEELDGCSFIMPEKDVTVSAEFEIITYTLTYDFGDDTEEVEYTVDDTALAFEVPVKDEFEKCGWYTFDFDYAGDFEFERGILNPELYKVESLEGLFGNVTLYAKYYNPIHKITCAEDCENGWFYVEDYYNGAQFGDLVNVAVYPGDGYELEYITVNGEQIDGTSFEMLKEDVEIDAVFKPIVYTITYYVNGVKTDFGDEYSFYTVESDGELPELPETEEGYYIGWCIDEECTLFIYGFDTNSREDLTFYAQYIYYE